MKIAIDIRNIGKKRTGDEVVFFNLVKNLSIIDSENEYLLLTDRNPKTDVVLGDEIKKLNLSENFRVIHLSEKGTNKFMWNAWLLPRYLRKNPVDILQVQYITPLFISKRIKIATILHDVSFKVFPELIRKSDLFLLNILIPLSLKRADKIIGVSKFTADEILKYYKIDEKKITWIHNAVSDIFFQSYTDEQIEAVRKKYSLPKNFILYLGTLQPRKNLPTLIEAYMKMPAEKRNDLDVVLVGGRDKNFDQKILDYINDFKIGNHVHLPGFIDEKDKPIIFKMARVFCFPSFYEGFGIPVLEAMTLGIPTVASNIPPHQEISEDSILLFDPNNSNDLAEKLNTASFNELYRDDLRQKEINQSKKFSWANTAKKMMEMYKKMQCDQH